MERSETPKRGVENPLLWEYLAERGGFEPTLSKSLTTQASLRSKKTYGSRGSYNIAIVTLDLPERATLR